MLPSSRFSRLTIAAAILVAVLLVLDLETVHSPQKSLLFSNALDLAMVLLAAICSFYVARFSAGYARQLWTLLAIALTLETVAQAISTYYQSFVPGSAAIPWPSDLLFFLWVTPVFMMFFPSSGDKSTGMDWLRLLDFVQIAIVAATAYLYFFYVPSLWQSNHSTLVRQILILYIVRDILLSTGFLFRARTSLSPWLRYFSVAMAAVFLAVALSNGDYLFTLGTFTGSASWGDLLWALPYLLVILLAANWKGATDVPSLEPPSRFVDFVVTHILPVGIPLLVIFMGRRIAKEQFLIAWLAIAASFLCSAFRLILTNRKHLRIGKELLSTERALRLSERMFASAFRWSPDAFSINVFPNGPYLDVNEGFTRLTGYCREETLDKTPSEMNLWVDTSQRARVLSQVREKGEVREQEFLFRNKAGQVRTGQMSAAVTDLDGRPCSLVIVRDVTARIEAENAIHRLSTQLLQLQDEERRRIGRELHDGLAQTVLAVNLSLAQVRQSIDPLNDVTAQALLNARSLLGRMSREIRTLSYLLHPPLLDDLGLVSALKEYANGFSERSGIDTQFYVLSEFGRLPQPLEIALFRIVQESLTNIQRHSGSASARIRLRLDSSAIILEVIDFGRGMKMSSNGNPQPGDIRLGVGVPGMRERMAQLGGRLDIDSSPAGTTVRATIPLPDVVSRETVDATPSHPHRG